MQATFDALLPKNAANDNSDNTPVNQDFEAIINQLKSMGDAITNLSKRFDELERYSLPSEGAPTNKQLMDEYDAGNGRAPDDPGESEENE